MKYKTIEFIFTELQKYIPFKKDDIIRYSDSGFVELIYISIVLGIDVNIKNDINNSPLMLYLYRNNSSIEIVKLFIDNGADVNVKNKYGETALSHAINWGNLEIAKLLKSVGAK